MSPTKYRNSRSGTFTTVVVLVAVLLMMSFQSKAAGDTASIAAAKSAFSAKCAMCHGTDGAGSEVGKSMHVPDLRSPVVQKLSNSELAEVIANGKNGMPSFKSSLNVTQIHGLVAYLRTMAAKK